jgi:hypothetical protein
MARCTSTKLTLDSEVRNPNAEEIFAGTLGKGKGAPLTVTRQIENGLPSSTHFRPSQGITVMPFAKT